MASGGRISKNTRQGKVEIDYEDCALLVNYEQEMLQLDDSGMVLGVLERKPDVRRIKIKSVTLTPDKNLAQMAADIVEKCKYIHPSRVEEIEQLLIKLRKHVLTVGAAGGSKGAGDNTAQAESTDRDRDRGRDKDRERDRDRGRDGPPRQQSQGIASYGGGGDRDPYRGDPHGGERSASRTPVPPADNLPPASMGELDDYLEMLYQVSGKSEKEREEGLKLQERGTGMILKLCRDVMNLEQLIQNSTVMGALTRVLQEEYKKSVDLSFNILRIFLAFSNFMEMHSLMANYKIGVLTMKALDFEIKRAEVREQERRDREAELTAELDAAKADMATYPSALEKVKRRREREAQKHRVVTRKQDKLLFVAFYILLNLAEDLNVERKMVRKQLIPSLAAVVTTRRFEDLLILCVTFLKKLCTVGENKDAVKELKLLDTLMRFIPCSSQPLITITLRLLFNLSFDKDIRDYMLSGGIVPRLVRLLEVPVYRAKTLKLLYHLSSDDRCKAMLVHAQAVPLLMGLVINFPQDFLAKELAALVVNLSYSPACCEQMLNNRGLNLLMDRLADKRDPLLLKIIRNITQWTFNQQEASESPETQYRYRGLWSPHIKVFLEIIQEEDKHDLLIEVFGCLANMTMYDLPATSNWSKLLREHGLLNTFCKMLVPGMAQNDLLLEIVMIVSTVASDLQACNLIASSQLIGLLYKLWTEKGDDTELLLQLIHCFHKLFMHDGCREEAMYSTRIVVDIIECLNHRTAAVRRKAEIMCDLVLEFDRQADGQLGNLGRKILQKKFESFNKTWLQAVEQEYAHHGYDYGVGIPGPGVGSMMADDQFFNDKLDESLEWKVDGAHGYANGYSNGYAGGGGSSSMMYEPDQITAGDYGQESWSGRYK